MKKCFKEKMAIEHFLYLKRRIYNFIKDILADILIQATYKSALNVSVNKKIDNGSLGRRLRIPSV